MAWGRVGKQQPQQNLGPHRQSGEGRPQFLISLTYGQTGLRLTVFVTARNLDHVRLVDWYLSLVAPEQPEALAPSRRGHPGTDSLGLAEAMDVLGQP